MSNTRRAIIALLVVLGLSSVAHAQQQVAIAGAGYDPCLDPSKVLTYVFDGSDAAHGSAATGNHENVALSGTTRIYFCGGYLQGSAAGTITVRFGTGTACATSPLLISTVSVVTNGDGAPFIAPGTFRRSNAGQALCIIRSASMELRGVFRYVQE